MLAAEQRPALCKTLLEQRVRAVEFGFVLEQSGERVHSLANINLSSLHLCQLHVLLQLQLQPFRHRRQHTAVQPNKPAL